MNVSSVRTCALLLALCLGSPLRGVAADRFVSLSGAQVYPYLTWANAARNFQSAIGAAAPGETVWVQAGTYAGASNRNVDLLGKSLLIQSAFGANATILDCGGESGFLLNGTGIVLRGFTIQGAHSNGLVCLPGSQSVIEDCVLRNCTPHTNEAVVTDLPIYNFNNALVYRERRMEWPNLNRGGAVFSDGARATFRRCTFSDNSASGAGGALYAVGSALDLESSTIAHSDASAPTNVLVVEAYVYDSNGKLVYSSIETKVTYLAEGGGGAGYFEGSSVRLSNCVLTANASPGRGGALSLVQGSTGVFVGCQFADNRSDGRQAHDVVSEVSARDGDGNLIFRQLEQGAADARSIAGGAVYGEGSEVHFDTCVLGDNEALGSGGALALVAGSTCTFHNSLLQHNRAGMDAYRIHQEEYAFDGFGRMVFRALSQWSEHGGAGGGIYSAASHVLLAGSQLSDNLAAFGAAYAGYTGATLYCQSTRFVQNLAVREHLESDTEEFVDDGEGNMVFAHGTRYSNEVYAAGAALGLSSSRVDLVDTVLAGNEGGTAGGLISAQESSMLQLTNVMVVGNAAGRWRQTTIQSDASSTNVIVEAGYYADPELIHLEDGLLLGVNCTLASNPPASHVLAATGQAAYVWVNTILQSYAQASNKSEAFTLDHCCVLDPDLAGTNVLHADPRVRSDGRLLAGSPCIDAGQDLDAPVADGEGEARWDDPAHTNITSIVDIGADEWVDQDQDGLPDAWELENYGMTNAVAGGEDADGDELTTVTEYEQFTNPWLPDTDGDGIPDGWELQHELGPLLADGGADYDDDGFNNLSEYWAATGPRDALDFPRIAVFDAVGAVPLALVWQGHTNRDYRIWASADLEWWTNVLTTSGIEADMIYTGAPIDTDLQYYRLTVSPP